MEEKVKVDGSPESVATFIWIVRIINSCQDTFHFDAATTLIKLFHERYQDQHLTDRLTTENGRRFNEVHNILS